MTQKRAKENKNPEPQTGRGHKLSWGTKNSQIARTRHTATTGTLRERTLRRGPAGGRRRGGRCRHQSPAWCTRHQGTLSAPVWAPATVRADGPRCRQGCGGTGTLTDCGGGPEAGGAVCGSDIQAHGEGRPSHAWASPPERGPAARRPARGRAGSYSASPEPGGLRTRCRVGGRPGRTPVSGGLSSDTARP